MLRRFIALFLLLLSILLPSCTGRGEEIVITFDPGDSLPSHVVLAEEVPEPLVSVAAQQERAAHPPVNYADFKGVWLYQKDLMDLFLSGNQPRSAAAFTGYATKIFQNLAASGFNTVIVQVRPNADSFYPSAVYPTSRYVTGAYGREAGFDPLAILIDLAHKEGLSIHAWINPLRCMSEENMQLVDARYQVRAWYDDPAARGNKLVTVDSLLYLNPAYPEVRELILSGAREILEHYQVDGIHMDDYFYPTTQESFDAVAYQDYLATGGTLSLPDFRRENLNRLVSDLYALTKATHPGLLFTISPAGNLDTVYHDHYADIYTWCSPQGYLDAIIPQVYFGLEHETHPFGATLSEWAGIVTHGSVRLFCGMTLEKAKSGTDPYAGTGEAEWSTHKDILSRSLSLCQKEPKCQGVVCFSYQYLFDPITGTPVPETQTELSSFLPQLQAVNFGE